MKKALVILSGGQDSLTCLFWALQRAEEVTAISFMYGQKHNVELVMAIEVCKMENVKHRLVDISFLPELVNSALVGTGGSVMDTLPSGLPASFVPNRNQLFITLAHAYAQKFGADTLVAGMCQTDYSGYPDCRWTYLQHLMAVTNNGSGAKIEIQTPLMFLTKAETFALADSMGVFHKVIEYSHTCYKGNRNLRYEWGYGCGECPACVLRKKGYEEYMLSQQAQRI